jgi:hypothetical protein
LCLRLQIYQKKLSLKTFTKKQCIS